MASSSSCLKNNPLLPYWSSKSGPGPHVLKSPNNLRQAYHILKSLPATPTLRRMVRRCGKCHRYTTGSPSPDLDHQGSNGGSVCTLDHHPSPCDWTDQQDRPCHFSQDLHVSQGEHGAGGPSNQPQVDQRLAALQLQVDQLQK